MELAAIFHLWSDKHSEDMKFPALIFLAFSLQTARQQLITDVNSTDKNGFDVLPGFINPPKGYGEVPFYWWQGNSLTRERIQ
jgi:hypothetical protein